MGKGLKRRDKRLDLPGVEDAEIDPVAPDPGRDARGYRADRLRESPSGEGRHAIAKRTTENASAESKHIRQDLPDVLIT